MDEPHTAAIAEDQASADDLFVFYEQHIADVYGFVMRRCGDSELAEDLTQEVFVSAARQFTEVGELPPSAWLFRVARNRLVDHWRRETRRKRKFRLISGGRADSAVGDLADGVVSTERAIEALNEIPVDQRAALVLRYLDDCSIAEIAETLGRSTKATESLLARARRALERTYEAQPNE